MNNGVVTDFMAFIGSASAPIGADSERQSVHSVIETPVPETSSLRLTLIALAGQGFMTWWRVL